MAPKRNNGTRNIRLAAEELQKALLIPEANRGSRVREAQDWLLQAADEHGQESQLSRALYFSPPEGEEAKVSIDDALSSIAEDVQVANALIAAGQVLNETGSPAQPSLLKSAIQSFDESPAISEDLSVLRFSAELTHSADLATATNTLRSRIEETLSALIREARDAGGKVVNSLSKVDVSAALEAVGELGGPLAALPKLGKLIKKGIEKLQNAMDALLRLLDPDLVKQIQEKMKAFWDKIKDGNLADDLLGWAFGSGSVHARAQALGQTGIPISAFDQASDLLPPLAEGFKTKMTWAKRLTGLIAAAAPALVFTGVAAGPVAAFAAGAYVLVLAAILAMGRDYAGAGGIFHQGKGVLGVIESLA